MFGSPVAGIILGHDVRVCIGRDFFGEKPDHLFCAGQAFGQDKVPYQQAPEANAAFIHNKVPDLSVHFLNSDLCCFRVVLCLGICFCRSGISVFEIRHVYIDNAVKYF